MIEAADRLVANLEPFVGEELARRVRRRGHHGARRFEGGRASSAPAADGIRSRVDPRGRRGASPATSCSSPSAVAPTRADIGLEPVGLEPGKPIDGRRPPARHGRAGRLALRDRRRQRARAAHAHGQVPGAHRGRRDPQGLDDRGVGRPPRRAVRGVHRSRSSRRSGSPSVARERGIDVRVVELRHRRRRGRVGARRGRDGHHASSWSTSDAPGRSWAPRSPARSWARCSTPRPSRSPARCRSTCCGTRSRRSRRSARCGCASSRSTASDATERCVVEQRVVRGRRRRRNGGGRRSVRAHGPITESPGVAARSTRTSSELRDVHLRDLFADDPGRGDATDRWRPTGSTSTTRRTASPPRPSRLLVALAERARPARPHRRDVPRRADQRHRGPRRAARRAAGARRTRSIVVDGDDVVPDVHAVLDKMADFAERVRSRRVDGHTGKRDPQRRQHRHRRLRPRPGAWRTRRCAPSADRDLDVPVRLQRRRHRLLGGDARPRPGRDAVHRLVEDVHHARDADQRPHRARAGSLAGLGGDERPSPSTSSPCRPTPSEVAEFGIDTANMFEFWDWVGGRYSLDSAIGLSLMIAIGPDQFREMLAGFHAIDEHFRTAPFEREPAGAARAASASGTTTSSAPRPTRPALQPVPRAASPPTSSSSTWRATASRSTLDGSPVRLQTGPDRVGHSPAPTGSTRSTSCIHQGTKLIPCRLHRLRATPNHEVGDHHDLLMANFFAQTEALAFGKTAEEVAAEGVPAEPGAAPHVPRATTRPTRSSPSELTPVRARPARRALRAQGVHPGRRSGTSTRFDQWGVELGKVLANRIVPELEATSRSSPTTARPTRSSAATAPPDADRRRASRQLTRLTKSTDRGDDHRQRDEDADHDPDPAAPTSRASGHERIVGLEAVGHGHQYAWTRGLTSWWRSARSGSERGAGLCNSG